MQIRELRCEPLASDSPASGRSTAQSLPPFPLHSDPGGPTDVTEPTAREGEGAWTKLRRRKVVQWGIVYVAGAWGLLQGIGFTADAFHWPDALKQIALLLLLLGLPIVLVLAWYHGDRGEQRVSRTELAILTLLFLLGGGLFWRYEHTSQPPSSTAATTAPASATTADSGPSIAVLPFENRSDEHKDAFFVDGIHDDILTQLSKISALKVISRTSVEQFRDTKLPTKAIAEQLGVKSILEGGVQRAGDRVRINVQLIDAGTDNHLWAETYDRELTAENIFAIQTELAAAIADALNAALTPAERVRVKAVPTRNLEAWEAYQLGKQRMAKRTSEALAEAEKFFQQAIDLDPTFALAYVGLADAFVLQVAYSGRPARAGFAEAEKAASRALELDPTLAEAWASKGNIELTARQPVRAEPLLRRAIELNPNYAPAHQWLSISLLALGRPQESLEHAERAVALDPLSPSINVQYGATLAIAGRFDEAAARYRRAIEIDASPTAYETLAMLDAYARNRIAEAVPLLQKAVALDDGNPAPAAALATVHFDLGDVPQATRLISAITRRWPDSFIANGYAAWLYSALGDVAAAERHAQKVLEADPREAYSIQIMRNVDLQKGDTRSARERYASAFPELINSAGPRVDSGNYVAAIDFALVSQRAGEIDRATALLDGSERAIRPMPRLGEDGYALADVQIHALRGDRAKALAALRQAERAGWRGWLWRYYRDVDPNLASIRDEPEFKAVFADIERDMARQRAELAARPKNAPLDLGESRK